MKKHCSSMESLPQDVFEQILKRLPAKSLLRFKSVSKKWKSTIESRYFREKQWIHRGDPDILLVHIAHHWARSHDYVLPGQSIEALESESSSPVTLTTVTIPRTHWFSMIFGTSCDGLICVFNPEISNIVVNPTTRWRRNFPLSSVHQHLLHIHKLTTKYLLLVSKAHVYGFGKDKFNGTYKPVCLYNSSDFGLENATTCEVFDFSTNTWRFVIPASPHRVISIVKPLYLDGSLHWLTQGEETNILSLDLHTETFQVISKLPFVCDHIIRNIDMFSLNNRLCVFEKKDIEQVIWSFDSGNKTWAKLYSIDLSITTSWFRRYSKLSALALPVTTTTGKKKNKLLFYGFWELNGNKRVVLLDPETNTYEVLYSPEFTGIPLSYSQSLITIP